MSFLRLYDFVHSDYEGDRGVVPTIIHLNLICQFYVFLVVNRKGTAFIQKTVQSRKLSYILWDEMCIALHSNAWDPRAWCNGTASSLRAWRKLVNSPAWVSLWRTCQISPNKLTQAQIGLRCQLTPWAHLTILKVACEHLSQASPLNHLLESFSYHWEEKEVETFPK